MEALMEFLAILAGLLIRLVIPLGLTWLIAILLHRLDRKWKEQTMKQLPLQAEERPACWEVRQCPPEVRADCPAYGSTVPCWQLRRRANGYLMPECLNCEVFLKAPIPRYAFLNVSGGKHA